MSITTVRGAIQAYLNYGASGDDPTIPGLNWVYKAQPTFIDPTRWWVLPQEIGGSTAGTIGYLHLALVEDSRIALPAVDGQVMVGYTVALVLIYRYSIPSADQATPMMGDEWIEGLDATLDGIKAWIRQDFNLGTAQTTFPTEAPGVIYDQFPGVIWEAGKDEGDLAMRTDPPVRDEEGGEVLSFQVLEFHAYEVITA